MCENAGIDFLVIIKIKMCRLHYIDDWLYSLCRHPYI